MENLKKIIKKCKASVCLSHNEHLYASIPILKKYIDTQRISERIDFFDIDLDIEREMVKRNSIFSLQFYLDNPFSSYTIYHYDVDECLERTLKELKIKRNKDYKLKTYKKIINSFDGSVRLISSKNICFSQVVLYDNNRVEKDFKSYDLDILLDNVLEYCLSLKK